MSKPYNHIIKYISIWILLNWILNEIALLITLVLNHDFSSIITSSLLDLKFLAIQASLFVLIFTIACRLIRKNAISTYLFVIFQSIIFHAVFLLNLENQDNTIIFSTTWDNIGLKYIEFNGTEITYLIGYFLPVNGIFDGGLFIPNDTYLFYYLWICTPLVIFTFITWLSMKIIKHLEMKYKL